MTDLNTGGLKVVPGVDWLSATTTKDSIGLAWFDIFNKVSKADGLNGKFADDWRAFGYSGRSCDGARWGYSGINGYLLVAYGHAARDCWEKIVPVAKNVTRLDLCVDCFLPDPIHNLANRHVELVHQAGQRKYAVIQSSGGGSTLYVGSRQSEQFGRLYDKGAQQGDAPGVHYRYEVQVNKPKSYPLAKNLYQKLQLTPAGHWSDIIGYVYSWFDGRGVKPIFQKHPNTIDLESSYRVTTADRKLSWLSSQVKPTVEKLIKEGLGDETLSALGLIDQLTLDI